MLTQRARDSIAVLCGWAYALAVVAPILIRPGIPAYQHDWSWPPDSATEISGAFNHLSTWDPAGLGSPNALASNNVLHVLIALPALIVSGGAALKLLVAVVACLAAFAMYYCARRTMNATRLGAAAASILYVTLPVFVNKLGAGHVAYWVAYALQPFIFERAAAYAESPSQRRIAQIALLSVLLTFQIQFAVFGTIVAIAGAARGGLKRVAVVFTACVVGAAVALAPTAYAFSASQRYVAGLYLAPKLSWESIFSTGFPDVFWMRRYVVPYADFAMRGWFFPMQCVIVAAILSALFIRSSLRWSVVALAAIALFFTTGTAGPVGSFWRLAFTHWPLSTVFRDLYNANALLALSYALGLSLLGRWRSVGVIALLAAAVAGTPLVFGGLARAVPAVSVDSPHRVRADVATLPPGRVASLPFDVPLTYRGHSPGGVDVMAVRDAMHPSLSEYPTLFPLTAWSMTKCACEPWFSDALSRANVVAAVERPDFSSEDLARQHVNQPQFSAWNTRALSPSQLVRSYSRATPQNSSFATTAAPDTVGIADSTGALPRDGDARKPQVIVPAPDERVDDPLQTWVSLERWYAYSADPLATVAGGVTTASMQTLNVAVPPGSWSVLYASERPLKLQSGPGIVTLRASLKPVWEHFTSFGSVQIRPDGGRSTVFRIARGGSRAPYGYYAPSRVVAVIRIHPWQVHVVMGPTARPALLDFAERFSEAWAVKGARVLWHGVGNGYSNVYVVAGGTRSFDLEYAPQKPFLVFSFASWALELLVAFFALSPERDHARALNPI